MNLGWPELTVVLAIALLLFGPSKLPGLGKSVGEAIRGFKKGLKEVEGETSVSTSEPNKESQALPSSQGATQAQKSTQSDRV